jgi:hypothetical protein
MPLVPGLGPATTYGVGKAPAEFPAPAADCVIGDDDAPLSKKELDIPQSEAEHMIQPDGMADGLGGESMAIVRVGCGLHAHSLAWVRLGYQAPDQGSEQCRRAGRDARQRRRPIGQDTCAVHDDRHGAKPTQLWGSLQRARRRYQFDRPICRGTMIMLALSGAQIHRSRRLLAVLAPQPGQDLRKCSIAALYCKQTQRKDSDALTAVKLQAALRPVGQVMGEAEGRRVHRRSLEQNGNFG